MCEILCDYSECNNTSQEVVETDEGAFNTCFLHLYEYIEPTPNLAQRNGFDAECLYQ